MATRCFARSLLPKLSSSVTTAAAPRLPSFSLLRLRSISAAAGLFNFRNLAPTATTGLLRSYSSLPTTSSLQDNNPNWSTRPPKETILLDGCDFEHWLVVLEKPEGEPTRDEIIDIYVKTLAQITGSEEEARAKIYSVSTRCYYAFGCLISEELTYKMKELPKVRWVLPDSYLDVRNKDYGGEPFINGQAVPYDPKYHEEWIRNNSRANERNRRNDRPRNSDRSRNFERRRENMENRDFNRTGPPNPAPNMGGMPPQNMGGMPPQNNMGGPPQNMGGMPPQNNMGGMPPQNMGGMPPQNNMGGMPPQNNMRGPPQNMGGMPPQNMGGMPPRNMGGPPQNNMGGMPPQNNMRGPPQNNMEGPPQGNMGGWGSPPPNNMGGPPPPNMGRMPPPNNAWSPPPNNMGGMPPPNNMGGVPPPQFQNNNGGNPPSGGGNGQYQNSYAPDMSGGGVPYQR